MPKIRQKRIVELVKEYEDATLIELSEQRLVAQKDEELFTVDTAGRQSRKRKARLDFSEVRSPLRHPPSKTESRLVKKLLATSRPTTAKKEATSVTDIWGDSEQVAAVGSMKRLPSGIALPGQSYNPSPRDHQNILAEAVALEIIKKENAEKLNKPVTALSTTAAVVVSQQSHGGAHEPEDDDEDDEEEGEDDDGEEEEEGSAEGGRAGAGRPKTLTRAQRNKKRRRSEESHRQLSEERHRRLLQSIDQLPKVLQEMAAAEKRRSARKVLEP